MPGEPPHDLGAAGIRFVRILWCDNANVIRGKAVHVGALASVARNGVGISAGMMGVPVMFDAVVPESGLGPVGEVRLVPDWSTFTPLPYAPGHARVIGDQERDGRPWPLCPRDFLRRILGQAREMGLEIKGAFENEFYLLRPTADGFVPLDDTVFAATLAMDLARPVIDEIADHLQEQGIAVEQYYPESGPGQQEMSIRFGGALQAADRQIAFRETVHAVARRHGLWASFLPKLFADKAGTGCHLHISLWNGEQNLVPDANGRWGLSDPAERFIGGLLHHLPALMAVTTPTPNSYRRIRPHFWSGAFRCWGMDNREAAVRVPTNPEGPPTNLELKTCDASANPYLAFGAVLAAGLDGIRRNLALPEPINVDPGNLAEGERMQRGVDPLPTTLGTAIEHFSRDEVLLDAMGPALAQAFLTVRWTEWEAFKGAELVDEVRRLLGRY